ncbi:restriction endonuclease subunit S [Bifidobacterium sp. MSK.13.7]|uniref:restriction endonuclease subunit S n=1 Tax=Bifidobacterium TaxID=1678 RepID=UPI001C391F14|nr:MULTISPECIES: restriction endonuclease subunit S [Bifidobacterium]MBV4126386.1 restriction endonuclease subunit S [Bifidobacterium pseudocatenulatum]MBV4140533.1 restriction endonuclease subunit S [Bifidobacterium sp. MSK.13.7]
MVEQHGKTLVPQIRFAGFTDPWEQRKLGELCSFSKGYGYSKNNLRDQGTPIILYGRLYTNYETQIHSVDTFVDPLENSVYTEGGEVIVPASGETAEDISIASVVEKPGIILGGDLNIITPSAVVNPVFLALELSYGKPHFDLAKRAQGKSVVHIHNEDIANVFFDRPCIAEQRRIGGFFDRLDSLITLHQRKYDKLCVLKKSMLDKMFPKGGSLYPEIRFAGFADPWEQRKVGDFLSESRVKGNTGLNSRKLTVKLWGKGVIEKNDFGGSEHTQYFIRHKGQFIYSKLDFLNSAFGVIPEKLDGYESTADLPAFDLVEMNPHFMFFTAVQEGFYLKHGSAADGSRKAKRIHVNTFLEMPIMVPTVAEQDFIVEYLQSLDCLITLHQRKLELLRNIKKSMLDKMFV